VPSSGYAGSCCWASCPSPHPNTEHKLKPATVPLDSQAYVPDEGPLVVSESELSTARTPVKRLDGWPRGGMAVMQTVSRIAEPRQLCAARLTTSAPGVCVTAVVSRRCLAAPSLVAPFVHKAAHARKSAVVAAAAPGVDPSILLEAPGQLWDYYQTTLGTNPIATKVRSLIATSPRLWSMFRDVLWRSWAR